MTRPIATTKTNASALHRKVFGFCCELFPNFQSREEANVEVVTADRKTTLFVDIVIVELNLAIECHGVQHFKYSEHFHGCQNKFLAACERDRLKEKTLRDNGFSYLVVRYDEERTLTPAKLLKKILKAIEE